MMYCHKQGEYDIENYIFSGKYEHNKFKISEYDDLFKVADRCGCYIFSYDFINNRFATGLMHRVFLLDSYDSNHNYLGTLTIRDRVRDIRWLGYGKYLLISNSKGVTIIDGNTNKIVDQLNMIKCGLKTSINSNFISLTGSSGAILFEFERN